MNKRECDRCNGSTLLRVVDGHTLCRGCRDWYEDRRDELKQDVENDQLAELSHE